MRRASVSVPTAFDATGNATTFVRPPSCRSRSSMFTVVSSLMSAKRTTRPRSCASSSHGDTFASWSSRVTRIWSPSLKARAAVRVSAKFSVVMFCPNTTSSASQPRKPAAASLPCATTASVRRLVSYGPPTFAFDSRKYAETASMTESGTCVPPGASKNAKPLWSALKRARTAWTSKAMVDMRRTLPEHVARAAGPRVRCCCGCGLDRRRAAVEDDRCARPPPGNRRSDRRARLPLDRHEPAGDRDHRERGARARSRDRDRKHPRRDRDPDSGTRHSRRCRPRRQERFDLSGGLAAPRARVRASGGRARRHGCGDAAAVLLDEVPPGAGVDSDRASVGARAGLAEPRAEEFAVARAGRGTGRAETPDGALEGEAECAGALDRANRCAVLLRRARHACRRGRARAQRREDRRPLAHDRRALRRDRARGGDGPARGLDGIAGRSDGRLPAGDERHLRRQRVPARAVPRREPALRFGGAAAGAGDGHLPHRARGAPDGRLHLRPDLPPAPDDSADGTRLVHGTAALRTWRGRARCDLESVS